MDHATLKSRQRAERELEPLRSNEALQLRIHRALSWLEASESAPDLDSRFIFLWIAFNAAYATEIDDSLGLSEQSAFRKFLRRLLELDVHAQIHDMIWGEFSDRIRNLLDNRYLCADFWRFQTGQITDAQWKRRFASANSKALASLLRRDTATVLGIVLSRVYVLRNQILHGGATWNSQVNREQVRVSVRFLERLVPAMIGLLLENPQEAWPRACYPVVEDSVARSRLRTRQREAETAGSSRLRGRKPPARAGATQLSARGRMRKRGAS